MFSTSPFYSYSHNCKRKFMHFYITLTLNNLKMLLQTRVLILLCLFFPKKKKKKVIVPCYLRELVSITYLAFPLKIIMTFERSYGYSFPCLFFKKEKKNLNSLWISLTINILPNFFCHNYWRDLLWLKRKKWFQWSTQVKVT